MVAACGVIQEAQEILQGGEEVRESSSTAPEILQQQVGLSQMARLAADPRTTNALLLIMALCLSGHMPDSLVGVCGV